MIDFTPYFKQYETILQMADTAFARIEDKYPDCIKCRLKCSDCCHALFDLTLIEALYINHHFNLKFTGQDREKMLKKADRADRAIYKIKRDAYKEYETGKSEDQILAEMAEKRMRCPLLSDEDLCDLYEYRPMTCRLYGVPTAIGGKGHTCGKSGFEPGKEYPTVYMDVLHQKLYDLSDSLVKDIKSKHVKMADLLVPLSMALITGYSDEYLGIGAAEDTEKKGEPDV